MATFFRQADKVLTPNETISGYGDINPMFICKIEAGLLLKEPC